MAQSPRLDAGTKHCPGRLGHSHSEIGFHLEAYFISFPIGDSYLPSMTFQSQDNLAEAKRWMVLLEAAMKIDGHWKHLDSAIEFECFSARLLNKIFGWSLERADFGTASQDSFDLADNSERIAV